MYKNYITKNIYQGGNVAILEEFTQENNFKSEYFLTFLQAKSRGLTIKKGSHGVTISKPIVKFEIKDEEGKPTGKIKASMGGARVFNLDQTEPEGKE